MGEAVKVEVTALPGIGVRQDVVTASGRRIGVVSHRDGHRDLVVYGEDDPDACSAVITLTGTEADALAEVLGAPRVVERLAALHEQAAGLLVNEQIPVLAGSHYDGRTLGETRARTRTGASIVAVLRQGKVLASPGPDFVFAAGDRILVVGTAEGTAAVARIFASG